MRSRKNQDNVPAINGSFAFNTSAANTTGNVVADAVLGNFYTYTEAGSFFVRGGTASRRSSRMCKTTGKQPSA
jgi:hypothetical protein